MTKARKIGLMGFVFFFLITALMAQETSIETIARSVVLVVPMRLGRNGRPAEPTGISGSGVLIDKQQGLIVTIYHVVEDGASNRPADLIKIGVVSDIADVPRMHSMPVVLNMFVLSGTGLSIGNLAIGLISLGKGKFLYEMPSRKGQPLLRNAIP